MNTGPEFDPFGEEVHIEDVLEQFEIRAAQLDWDNPNEVARFEIDLAYAEEEYDEPDAPYEPIDDYEALEAELRWKAKRYASREQRQLIFERDGGKCHYCDVSVGLNSFHADHKQPFSKGGKTDIDNLVCACYSCNKAKFAMDYEDYVVKLSELGIEWRNQERDRVVQILKSKW